MGKKKATPKTKAIIFTKDFSRYKMDEKKVFGRLLADRLVKIDKVAKYNK